MTLQELRRNQALPATDLEELERLLLEAGGSAADIEAARYRIVTVLNDVRAKAA